VSVTLPDQFVHSTYRNTYVRRLRSCGRLSKALIRRDIYTSRDVTAPWCSHACVGEHGSITFRRQHALIEAGSAKSGSVQMAFGAVLSFRSSKARAIASMTNLNLQTQELTRLLYSVSEAAAILSCSRNTVYALMRSGEILAVYPTSKARISADSLVRFVRLKEDLARQERAATHRRSR